MIFDFFNGLFDILYSLIDMLPSMDDFGLDVIGSFINNSTYIQQGLTWLNFFVPVGYLLYIIGIWAGCIVAYSSYLVIRDYFREYRK